MSRIVRVALAAAAVAALAPLGAAHADPEPLCKLWWERRPSVAVDQENHTVTVDPGSRPMWVC